MAPPAEVFEQTYRGYLRELAALDLPARAGVLGAQAAPGGLVIPFYGTPYRVAAAGIVDAEGRPAPFAVAVVLCRYVLMCPAERPEEGDWRSYREFKDAGPLTVYFANNTNKIIESSFGADPAALERACRRLGGEPYRDDASHDFSMCFSALPRIPVLLRFNFKAEEFPAQCAVLFRRSAETFLDMESLAITGTFLAGGLIRHRA